MSRRYTGELTANDCRRIVAGLMLLALVYLISSALVDIGENSANQKHGHPPMSCHDECGLWRVRQSDRRPDGTTICLCRDSMFGSRPDE